MSSFWEGKRVAVLGGAGMIGSALAGLLVEAGADVTVADNLSRGRKENLDGLGVRFLYDDLGNIHNLRAVKGKDAVFNLAARVTGMHYNRLHHDEMFVHNLMLQIVPLRASVMWEVPLFLQCSTVCVYPRDMSYPVKEAEGHRGEPEPTNSGYGWAKRMGELYAQWVYKATGMGIGITRFSNCFGPRDYFDPETSHVIPALIKKTMEDDVVRVYGSGDQIREFLYAKDAAIGAMKVLERYPVANPVNVGNPNNRVNIQTLAYVIQNIIFDHSGVFKRVEFDTSIEDGYPRRGSDISKLINVTGGWQPETHLVPGLRETIDWYRANKELAEKRGW